MIMTKQTKSLYNKTRYARKRAEIKAQQALYRKANAERLRAAARARYKAKATLIKSQIAAYRAAHPTYYLERYRRNPAPIKAAAARYRASLYGALPKWLSASQFEHMAKIYAECPAGHHVDHIVPLQSAAACGLHVPWNLQYLPAADNYRKGNRL